MRRLKLLKEENGKLKKLVGDLSLDKEMLQDVIRDSYEVWSEAQAGRRGPQRMAGLRSAGPVALSNLTARPITTSPIAPTRLPSNRRSRRSAMFVSATVVVVFTSYFFVKVGAMARTRRGASIANWACNCATKRPSAGSRSRPSCAMIAGRRHDRTRPGRWTSSMTSWRERTQASRAYDR